MGIWVSFYFFVFVMSSANSLEIVPKFVFWTEDYPKTASGKIQKFKLQEEGEVLVKEGKGLE